MSAGSGAGAGGAGNGGMGPGVGTTDPESHYGHDGVSQVAGSECEGE